MAALAATCRPGACACLSRASALKKVGICENRRHSVRRRHVRVRRASGRDSSEPRGALEGRSGLCRQPRSDRARPFRASKSTCPAETRAAMSSCGRRWPGQTSFWRRQKKSPGSRIRRFRRRRLQIILRTPGTPALFCRRRTESRSGAATSLSPSIPSDAESGPASHPYWVPFFAGETDPSGPGAGPSRKRMGSNWKAAEHGSACSQPGILGSPR